MRAAKINQLHRQFVPEIRPQETLDSAVVTMVLRMIDVDTLDAVCEALDRLDNGREMTSQQRAMLEALEERFETVETRLRSCTKRQHVTAVLSELLPWELSRKPTGPLEGLAMECLTAEIWPQIEKIKRGRA